jgi:hypothetical protein
MSELEDMLGNLRAEPTPLHDELRELFAADIGQTRLARELYASLCNNVWERNDDKLHFTWRAAGGLVASLRNEAGIAPGDESICEVCGKARDSHREERRKNHFAESIGVPDFFISTLFCGDGDDVFVPPYTGQEDYMDFYCSGGEGRVAPWVAERLASSGWKHVG